MRIDRAFRAAHILQSRDFQKAALLLAAGGALLTGAGLGVALGIGIFAKFAMQAQARSSRRQARALIAQGTTPILVIQPTIPQPPAIALPTGVSGSTSAAAGPISPSGTKQAKNRLVAKAPVFDFDMVPKLQRVLAAIALKDLSGTATLVPRESMERALGEELMGHLRALLQDGTADQRKKVLSWDRGRSQDAFASASALRRAGERDSAANLDRIGRQRVISERQRGRDRD